MVCASCGSVGETSVSNIRTGEIRCRKCYGDLGTILSLDDLFMLHAMDVATPETKPLEVFIERVRTK
jgi:hypothetical protein